MSRPLTTLLPVALLVVAGAMIGPASATQEDATVFYEGDELTLQSAPDRSVTGETTVPAGETLLVRARSSSSGSPFLRQREVTVTEDGTFTTTFDMGSIDPGTGFELTVLYNGTELTTVEGRVVECTTACDATPTDTPTPTPAADDAVTAADELTLNRQVVRVENGTARIPVSMGDADEATLVIGGEDAGFETEVILRDGTGDGLVVFLFRPGNLGDANATAYALEDERDTLYKPVVGDQPDGIDPGDYDLSLYRGPDPPGGEPVDVGTLVVDDASVTLTVSDGGPATESSDSTDPTGTATIATGPVTATGTGTNNGGLLGGGAIAVGGLLALVGVAVMLGFFRG